MHRADYADDLGREAVRDPGTKCVQHTAAGGSAGGDAETGDSDDRLADADPAVYQRYSGECESDPGSLRPDAGEGHHLL